MQSHNSSTTQCAVNNDEINLRELFAIVMQYKKFIIGFTMLVTVIAVILLYRMPKYYKTSIVIEVKPKKDTGGGLGSGGGALLSLKGMNEVQEAAAKDAALTQTYYINEQVLDKVNYATTYWYGLNFRDIEAEESNCSIVIENINIPNYKHYGTVVRVKEVSSTHYKLYAGELLGEYAYGEPIQTEYFSLTVKKNGDNKITPDFIVLNSNKRYIYNKYILKNLTVETDKKGLLPFLTLSYLDTLPSRGKAYMKTLIDTFIQQSISNERESADITLGSLAKQIKKIEDRVSKTSTVVEQYKSKNKVISPSTRASLIIKKMTTTKSEIDKNRHKKNLVDKLINSAQENKLDTIAPSLPELGDKSTIALVNKLQVAKLNKAKLANRVLPTNPLINNAEEQIVLLKSMILSNLKNLKSALINQESTLLKLQKDYEKLVISAPTTEKELGSIMLSQEFNKAIYTHLLKKQSAAEIEKAEAVSRLKIIEPIYTNPRAAKPNKKLMLIITFIMSFTLSVLIVFFREQFSKEKYTK